MHVHANFYNVFVHVHTSLHSLSLSQVIYRFFFHKH